MGRETCCGDRRLGSPVTDCWRWFGRRSPRRAAAAEQRQRARGNSDGCEGKDWAQPRAARGASMWPREGARRLPGLGGSAEGRVRRRRSGGGRGSLGSGDRVARLDQQVARGATGVHKEEFRRSWELELRLKGEAHRRRQWRERRWLGRMCVRARDGWGWLISTRDVGWGRWGHTGATCTRGEAGAWPATCATPAANGVPRAVRRPVDQRHLARPLATDDMGEPSPALRSDKRSLRRLGVLARRGYGMYGGWPMWPRTTSRP
jgi:hypothetical protein